MSSATDITDYLKVYLDLEQTDFAIMLTGEWGCGKTFFINDFLKKQFPSPLPHAKIWQRLRDKATSLNNFIKVSLNGISRFDQLESTLLSAMFPFLDNKFSRLVKGGIGIVLKKFVPAVANETNAGAKFLLSCLYGKVGLFVFDDLERCRMPIEETLGFFSSLVEHGHKVVIIGTEDELSEDNKDKFMRLREKVIGKTFSVHYTLSEIFAAFLDGDIYRNATPVLERNQDELLSLFYRAGKQNFRALQHTFRDLEMFLARLPDAYRNKTAFCDDFVRIFVSLDYEKQIGGIKEEDFVRPGPSISGLTDQEGQEFQKLLQKYGLSGHWINAYQELILPDEMMKRLLWDKELSTTEICQALDNTRYFIPQTDPPDWYQLWHWRKLEDEEAKSLIATITDRLKNHAYKQPGEIAHIFCSFVDLAKSKVIPQPPDQVVSQATDYIGYLTEHHELELSQDYDTCSDSWRGHRYWGSAQEDQTLYRNILSAINTSFKSLKQSQYEANTLNDLKSELLKGELKHEALKEPTFMQFPVLAKISANEFFQKVLQAPNATKLAVAFALSDRWSTSPNLFRGEISFAEQLQDACNAFLHNHMDMASNPSYCNIAFLRDKIKERIDQCTPHNASTGQPTSITSVRSGGEQADS